MTLRKKIMENGRRIKEVGIFLSLLFSFSCFFGNEISQYVAFKDGNKLQPYAKVIYKVSVERQEVVYWIESPGKDRSQLYKLKKSVVADLNNWEGEADYILLWKIRIEVINGKFNSPGVGLVNVGWFEWHFGTDPSPSYFSTILRYLGYGFLFFAILGAIVVIVIIVNQWIWKRKKRMAAKT
jgi:hypothetical protein